MTSSVMTSPSPVQQSERVNEERAAGRVGTQLLRLAVQQSGKQRTSVTISEQHCSPVLHVRAGGVFVYASVPEVVAAHLAAWRDTALVARQVLPVGESAFVAACAAVESDELSVIVRQDSAPAVAVTRYPGGSGHPARPPYVETVVGPLAVRSFDRVAVTDLLGVWMQAAALGAIAWSSPALAAL